MKKELRILFTGVGRRIELIQAFREAALVVGVDLKIYGADMTGTAPALAYCDFIRKVCAMKDDNYIYVVSSKANNVREHVQNLNKAFNGKGGGRDTYAQGKIVGTKESILEYLK